MSERGRPGHHERLVRECRLFCAYLSDSEPGPDLIARYLDLHAATLPPDRLARADRAERLFLRLGSNGRVGLRLADAYTRLVRPGAILRCKLILALAILENAPSTHRQMHRSRVGAFRAWMALILAGATTAFTIPVSLLVLGPLHAGARLLPEREIPGGRDG